MAVLIPIRPTERLPHLQRFVPFDSIRLEPIFIFAEMRIGHHQVAADHQQADGYLLQHFNVKKKQESKSKRLNRNSPPDETSFPMFSSRRMRMISSAAIGGFLYQQNASDERITRREI